MPIYTRTGDKGQTSLFNGTRVSKADLRVETFGTIDELNSSIGAVLAFMQTGKHASLRKELKYIQNDLLTIGSTLARPGNPAIKDLPERIKIFEKLIDRLTARMPELRNFILPGQ